MSNGRRTSCLKTEEADLRAEIERLKLKYNTLYDLVFGPPGVLEAMPADIRYDPRFVKEE